jgi:hypothetical protein
MRERGNRTGGSRVATRVRSLAALALALASLSPLACTAPVEAESLELTEPPSQPEAALPSWSHVPDAAAQPVDPDTQPRLVLELDVEPREGFCPYQVEVRNFPAIDVEGTTLVRVDARVPGASDGEDERMWLTYVVPDQDQRDQTVYDRDDDFDHHDGTSHCDAAIATLRDDVDAINADLASRTWRPLERLDVVATDEYFPFVDWSERIDALPLDQRPVEVLYRGGYFIARVRQTKVLLELDRPHWQLEGDPFCSRNPNVNGIEVDRLSQLALVSYDHQTGACLCYADEYVDVVRLPSALLDEVDRRPVAF